MRLTRNFYTQHAMQVAPELLGKVLCRKVEDKIFRYHITETECYYSEDDTACHAHKGKTPRTKVLYEQGAQLIFIKDWRNKYERDYKGADYSIGSKCKCSE